MRAAHHFSVQADRPDETALFLSEIIGLPETHTLEVPPETVVDILKWPESPGVVSAKMYGVGGPGSIEVVAIPDELKDRVTSRSIMPCFAVRDIAKVEADCKERGIAVSPSTRLENETINVKACVVTAGGVDFEIVQFEAPA